MYLNLLILLLSSFSYAIEDNAATEISFNTTAATMATTTISLSTISESVTTLPGNETAINRIVLSGNDTAETSNSTTEPPKIGCTCGIFLSGQFKKGSKEPPKGNPALLNEHFEVYPCNNHGNKLCSNKCLDVIVKHLPNSSNILCGAIDRDCVKERAYLFIKNCKDEWVNTNLSAGREYCCKDGLPYKCPVPMS